MANKLGVVSDSKLYDELVSLLLSCDMSMFAKICEEAFGGRIVPNDDATYTVWDGNYYMGGLDDIIIKEDER